MRDAAHVLVHTSRLRDTKQCSSPAWVNKRLAGNANAWQSLEPNASLMENRTDDLTEPPTANCAKQLTWLLLLCCAVLGVVLVPPPSPTRACQLR